MWHVSISNHTSPICVMITESGGEVCVCETDMSWGFMGCEDGLPPPLLPPPLPLTLGGNYLVMRAPCPPPSPSRPIWSPEPNPAAVSGQPPHLHPSPD